MQEELTTGGKGKSNGKWAKNAVNQADSIKDQVVDGARQAYDTVSDTASNATDYISGFNASPLSFIREYPMQAAIGGVILGFILGSAVSRKAVTE